MAKNKDTADTMDLNLRTEDANLLLTQLREPRYFVKSVRLIDPDITYRRINLWERNGLFAPHRETEKTGWRRFSFSEVIWLLTISDLRRVGMPTPIIRHSLSWLARTPMGVTWLETLLVTTIRGMKNVLIIGVNGQTTIPLNDYGILSKIRSDTSKGPMVCCPFYDYVRKVLTLSGAKLDFTESQKRRFLSQKEKRILEIIDNDQYEHIEIVKRNGESKTIKALTRRKGDFTVKDVILQLQARDYQTVEISVRGDRIVTLNATDIHKL